MKRTLLFSLLMAGCATTQTTQMQECPPGECKAGGGDRSPDEQAVRRRAAFDLHCDGEKLAVTAFDQRSFGVEGCGQRATYVNTCADRVSNATPQDCTWVANALSK